MAALKSSPFSVNRVSSSLTGRRQGLTLGLAALSGVLFASALPRGATTQLQALTLLAGGLGVGLLAGIVSRSRWALLYTPLWHAAFYLLALEFVRPALLGPTVGAIRLNEVYGVLAFLLGRGLYGLVVLLPMVLGASLGVFMARRNARISSTSKFPRWIVPGLTALVLAALIVQIALPILIRKRVFLFCWVSACSSVWLWVWLPC